MATTSAGILLYRRLASSLELLLVHPGGPFWAKRDEGAWSIPKGEVRQGEEPRECALRELREELGPAVELDAGTLAELGTVRQRAGKRVHCWAAEGEFDPDALCSNAFEIEWPPRSGRRQEFPEVDRAEWLAPALARGKIIAAQAELIDRLLALLG